MISGLKSASRIDQLFAVLFALFFVLTAVQLKVDAFLWATITHAHLRVLELEHNLRELGVEP